MSKASRKRARVVKRLHKQGFAVRGYIPGAPDALQPRLRSWITKQAESSISKVFAPAEKLLDSRAAKITALQDKRARDNQAFHSWLASQQANINASAAVNQQNLRTQINAGQKELTDQLTAIVAQSQAQKEKMGGGTGAIDTTGTIAAQQGAIRAGSEASQARIEQRSQMAGGLAALGQANAHVALKAQNAREYAQSLKDLEGVTDERTKLALQKAGAQADRIAKDLEAEVQKGQFNVQMQAAGAKLGLDQAKLAADIAEDKRTSRDKRRADTLTHRDKVAERAQQDRQKRADFIAKHGYTPEQWLRFSPSHRRRLLKDEAAKKGGGAGEGGRGADETNRIQKARSHLSTLVSVAGGAVPPDADATRLEAAGPRPNVGRGDRGQGRVLLRWLNAIGVSGAYADAAVFYVIYGRNAKLPAALRRRLKAETGIRGLGQAR